MFWCLLPIAVFLIIIIYGLIEGEPIASLFLGLIIGTIVLIIGLFIDQAITPYTPPIAVPDKDHPVYLVSLGNDQYSEGHFYKDIFVMSGSFCEVEKFRYHYYLNGESGAIASGEVNAEKALIFEDTETRPYLLRYKVVCPKQEKSIFYIYVQ